ncbi:MAG: META domain-containing protein [Chloroflexi bacterium]|nr:META domain-containing protein [Chloroflexota bacterium]MCC6892296.1 META domain-containing protein [Anaerolineae bacterium]
MKLRFLVLSALLALTALVVLPAAAQSPTTATVGYDGFSFSYDTTVATHIDIDPYAGDPPDAAGMAEVKHVQFTLSDSDTTPSLFDAAMGIRVYNTADFAMYPAYQQQYDTLQGLVGQQTDLTPFMTMSADLSQNTLPFVPVVAAGQAIRARAQYIETASVRGIGYITMYRQDVAPFLGNEFFYTFQGVSVDGSRYITAVVKLNTALFPAEVPADFNIETFQSTYADYVSQSIGTLNSAQPTDFTPSLDVAAAFIQSFSFNTSPAAQPTVPPVATTDPAVGSDPTLGGLAGVNWQLVSIGPNAVTIDNPITLLFSPEGIGGNSGCNSYFGQFQYDSTTLTMSFSNIGGTLIACEEPLMTQEMTYLSALQTVTGYQLQANQLLLTYPEGQIVFQPGEAPVATVPPTLEVPTSNTDPTLGGLAGVQWVLVSYGPADAPVAALPQAPVTLDFTAQGVSGSAGCNQYSGTFVYATNTLTFSPLVTTEMACADAAVTAQETAYLAALQAANLYSVDAGSLQIVYPDGLLVFGQA